MYFKSPQRLYKREYAHDYGHGGTFNSDCFTKGIAELPVTGSKATPASSM
jgi:hypothetical protein